MSQPQPQTDCQLSPLLDVFCPMHVILDDTGHIRHVGPTLQKLRPGVDWSGQRFMEVFELRRPRAVSSMSELLKSARVKLHMRFRDAPQTDLKGVLAPMPECGGAVVNLSFGISLMDAVREYALTSADFAATDLAIEMLYLVEAKSSAMEASRKLNLRLQGAKIAAEEQAYTDTLTGLKNRRAMDHVLERLLASDERFALMHIDLDYFKAVNDTLGHAAGDHVLQEVAKVMVAETRKEDTVARVGGDEFVIIFNKLTDRERLERVARRIIDKLEEPMPFGDQLCKISASCGTVLSVDYDTPDASELLADADLALYASKNAGRAQHCFFSHSMRAAGIGAPTPPAKDAANNAPPHGVERRSR